MTDAQKKMKKYTPMKRIGQHPDRLDELDTPGKKASSLEKEDLLSYSHIPRNG